MKLLAAVDLSEASLLSLDALIATWGDEGGDVTLLHVVDLDLYTAGGSVPGIMEFAKQRLREESERLAGCGLRIAAIRVEQGDSTQTILRIAAEENTDLVVMTNLGKGARTGRLFGSVAERVAANGYAPVLIERVVFVEGDGGSCRLAEDSPFERMLIAIDIDHDPQSVIDFVEHLPGVGEKRVVHVVREASGLDNARMRIETLMQAAPAGIAAEAKVVLGKPAEAILKAAAEWNATAIAVSPCAHGTLHRAIWGSVAREIALHARCSVLFIPSAM